MEEERQCFSFSLDVLVVMNLPPAAPQDLVTSIIKCIGFNTYAISHHDKTPNPYLDDLASRIQAPVEDWIYSAGHMMLPSETARLDPIANIQHPDSRLKLAEVIYPAGPKQGIFDWMEKKTNTEAKDTRMSTIMSFRRTLQNMRRDTEYSYMLSYTGKQLTPEQIIEANIYVYAKELFNYVGKPYWIVPCDQQPCGYLIVLEDPKQKQLQGAFENLAVNE